jgi:fibronectin-binding autotransporter adhesin
MLSRGAREHRAGQSFRAWLRTSTSLASIAGIAAAAGIGVFTVDRVEAGQLQASAFQVYNPANASSIVAGPFALYTVPVDSLAPTQMNEGFTEVDKKATGFDILQPSQQETVASLLGDIEPVVIGPGGKLYLTDGHHTFTALEDSAYGSSNLPVYVNVIANYSNLTTAQFWAQMEAANLLLPLNDGVPQVVNTATGSPIPTTLTGLTSDVYRGLEYSILKNKNSKLFTTTSNISGVKGSAIPGIDKETGLYADFINADAYRNANGGLGLPYLSPGDIQIATQWNLNPASVTTMPNVGTITVAQLPGYILEKNLTVSTTISNSTLSTGTLDGNGGFTGITQFNLGTPSDPILVGTPQVGFVMQLGNDAGFTATLSGTNTYTGGTTITAGDLIISSSTGAPSDSALGAAPTLTTTQFNNSLTLNSQGVPTNAPTAIQADNGIIFNSLTEGNGTLTIGGTAGGGTATFTTNRPIGVDSEAATINVNGYIVTLGGPLVSLGTNDVALGNANGESDLTIDDLNSGTQGKLILSTASPYFYGNIIIGNTGTPTVEVMSDAALGATTLNGTVVPVGSAALGQVELNGGTLQAGASFSSNRSLFLGGGSTYDTNGYTNSWAGTLTDVQRTLTIENSNSSGTNAVGSVTFGSLAAGATATIAVDAGTGTTGGKGTDVTFTNGITRNGNTDAGAPANATVFIDPATGSNLGVSGTNGVQVFSSGASTSLTNGIVPVWIITDSGGSASTNPYNFLTYNSTNGYTVATYTSTFGASNVVQVSSNQTLNANTQAYALNVENSKTITIGSGDTLTIGNGTSSAGLILEGTTTISGGTLAFGASEAVIDVKSTNTINSAVTGTGGLTLSGSGTLVLGGTAGGLSGPITVDSGTLQLNTANYFPTTGGGTTVWLSNVKSKPSNAILAVDANNVLSALNSDGNNSAVTIASGVTLTIGDSNNLSSTLSSTITGTGTGSLVKAGTGLLDISGSGGVSFGTGASVSVNAGELRIGNGVFGTSATTPISVASGAELQYSGNGGSVFNDPISGAGDFNLVGGTVKLTGTNTYTGGTNIQIGATLDVTTASLPIGGAISNAGGTLVFDQSSSGTFSGVMSNGLQAGGDNDPNDMACTIVSCSGTALAGTFIRDDSTTNGSNITITSLSTLASTYTNNNVTLSSAQTYTGATYVEAGALTLGAVNTIATSSGVTLGRVGGGATAVLALGANNQIAGLADNPSNSSSPNNDFVLLNGNTLTLAPVAATSWSFGGQIVDGTASGGSLVQNGPGTSILTGTNSYTGTTTIDAGTLEVDGSITNSSGITINSGGTLTGHGTVDPPTTMTITSGGNFAPGTPGSPGTSMTVSGNLAFQAGANYIVQLNPTTSTFANVTGTAALGGANVLAAFQPGSYVSKQQYTILQSGGLGGTTFGQLATVNLPNFSASLSYNANDVFLNLNAATLGAGSGLTGNQQNVAGSLNNFFNSGGALTPNFANIFAMSGGNLNTALAQLSGESSTATEQASFTMMSGFLGIMVDPSVDGRGGAGGGTAAAFAPEQEASFPPDIALAYASVLTKAPPAPADFAQRWTAWGSSFGGTNKTDGSAAAGTNTVTAQAFGFAGGLDYHVTPGSVIGFALAGSGSNWATAQNLGTGRSDSFQFGVYGTTRSGPLYLSASAGIANHWFTTDRTAPLGDQLKAQFDGQSYGARLESGYRYGVTGIGVTPYAALQSQLFHTPSYSETDLSGGGFGLSYAAMTATDTRSELGSRFDNLQVVGGMPLILRAKIAWAHDWVSNPSLSATFQALPGANFVVNGAAIPANSALTSAGAELRISPNWSLMASFDGEFAKTSQTYTGTGTIKYLW